MIELRYLMRYREYKGCYSLCVMICIYFFFLLYSKNVDLKKISFEFKLCVYIAHIMILTSIHLHTMPNNLKVFATLTDFFKIQNSNFKIRIFKSVTGAWLAGRTI